MDFPSRIPLQQLRRAFYDCLVQVAEVFGHEKEDADLFGGCAIAARKVDEGFAHETDPIMVVKMEVEARGRIQVHEQGAEVGVHHHAQDDA